MMDGTTKAVIRLILLLVSTYLAYWYIVASILFRNMDLMKFSAVFILAMIYFIWLMIHDSTKKKR